MHCAHAIRKKIINFQDKSNATRSSDNNKDDRGGENEDGEGESHLSKIDHVPYRGLSVKLDETGETFYNLVNDRHSVRKFNQNRMVDRSVIEKCILAAGK